MKHFGKLAAATLCGSLFAACSGGTGSVAPSVPSAPGQSVNAAPASGKMSQEFRLTKPMRLRCTVIGRKSLGAEPNTPQICDTTTNRIKHVLFTRAFLKRHPKIQVGRNAGYYSSSSSNNLVYGGGPVETTPAIYLIFWGINGPNDTTNDPNGMATYITNFYGAVGGSSWMNTDTQYYQNGPQYIGNPSGELAGVWYDTSSSPPSNYTDAQVAAEADAGSAHFGYNANANYVVVTPTGTAESGFGSQWCAYHSIDGNGVSYTDMPYVSDAGSGCGAGSVNSPGTLDGVSIVGGHEEAETQTDPGAGNGWIDSSGSEIGDKCAWMNLQNTNFPNGSTFPTQPLWSNASSGCVQAY